MKTILFIFAICIGQMAVNAQLSNSYNYNDTKQLTEFSGGQTNFVENEGQITYIGGPFASDVKFILQRGDVNIYLMADVRVAYQINQVHYPNGYRELASKAVHDFDDMERLRKMEKEAVLETYRMDMHLIGANKNVQVIKELEGKDYLNYYTHNALGVKHYAKITYKSIYDGIDWILYVTEDGGLKYDFVVHPGADPKQIQIQFTGHEKLQISENGDLIHGNRMGQFTEKAPVSFQNKRVVNTKFILNENILSFDLNDYAKNEILTIDPERFWGTYYGGVSMFPYFRTSCTTDANNNVYLAGTTSTTAAIAALGHQNNYGGGSIDAMLIKFNSSGVRIWATYYGGSQIDYGYSCAADAMGNVYLSGTTESSENIALNGHQNTIGGSSDLFLAKFNSNGSRLWSTYYGGSDSEYLGAISIDANSNIYLTGVTSSSNNIAFNGFQSSIAGGQDAFLIKFSGTGIRLWSTYFGGSNGEGAHACAVDINGDVYICGSSASNDIAMQSGFQTTYGGGNNNAFLAKFNTNGALIWSTYYGDNFEHAFSCATDSQGNVYMCGYAWSFNLGFNGYQNTSNGFGDLFLVKFNQDGLRLWSTYYGGSYEEYQAYCHVDINDNVYLCGRTGSQYSIAKLGHQMEYAGINWEAHDAFLAKFNSSGARLWATYYGGSNLEMLVSSTSDSQGNVYLAGYTSSLNNISFNGYQNNSSGSGFDLFLAKFDGVTDPCASWIQANVNVFSVQAPSNLAGNYDFTFAAQYNDWAVQNYNNVSLTGEAVLVNDGTAADSLGCNPLVNGSQVNGKIAVVYRGECEFGLKALHAQNAGAIAVVIINNQPGLIEMWGATYGNQVNIPVVMITSNDGALLVDALNQGTLQLFLGSLISNSPDDAVAIISDGTALYALIHTTSTQSAFVQWLDCDNQNSPIPGQDFPTFTPTNCGNYALQIYQTFNPEEGCVGVSSCIPINAVQSTTNISSCGSYTLNGTTYTNSTQLIEYIPSTNGCDTMILINLTITDYTLHNDVIVSNSPITWIDGNTYTASNNTATFFIESNDPNICDSLITLNFTLFQTEFFATPLTNCNPDPCSSYNYQGPKILINEVMLSPSLGDGSLIDDAVNLNTRRGEWIELYNPNLCESVDISCYYMGSSSFVAPSGGFGFRIPNNTIVPPGGFVLLRGLNAPPVPANELIINGGNTIEIVLPAYVWEDGVCTEGNRVWFPNVGGWFAFYDTDGVPQDAISWANQSGIWIEPCVALSINCPTVATLSSYENIPVDRKNLVSPQNASLHIDQSVRRIPDGGQWSGIGSPTYATCNSLPCQSPPISATCDGSVFLLIQGGQPPYQFYWSDPTSLITFYPAGLSATGLCQGDYSVTVIDNNGASITTSVSILTSFSEGTDTQTACSSFTWIDGNTYTSSNNSTTFNIVGGAANGCDSLVTLNLTILQPAEGTDTQTACSSFTWIDGNTYTSSNNSTTFNIVGGAANGCDSLVTLNLTILQPAAGTDTQTACSSFTWIDGNTYTASNNSATFNIVGGAANGCDSLVTLNLTILQPAEGTDTQSACSSFTWIDGNTYTSSNNSTTFNIVGGAANGCDSLVTLNLTILQPAAGTDTQTACSSFTWIDGNTYTASNNSATFNILGGAANGCDSLVTLNLTILQPAEGTDTQTACSSFTWIDGNTYTASNNSAIFNIVGGASNGCDSLVTLNLTIENVDVSVTLDGITLTAGATNAEYQWLNCLNNSPIAGATNQSFTATENGDYAVIVFQGNCSDTSVCVKVSAVSIVENKDFSIIAFPNPTQGTLKIQAQNTSINNLRVLDLNGKVVLTHSNLNQSSYELNLSPFENGFYIVEIKTEYGVDRVPVVKNDMGK